MLCVCRVWLGLSCDVSISFVSPMPLFPLVLGLEASNEGEWGVVIGDGYTMSCDGYSIVGGDADDGDADDDDGGGGVDDAMDSASPT